MLEETLEVIRVNPAGARRAHDVAEVGHELHDFEAVLAKIPIATEVSVAKPEQVSKLVCENALRQRRAAEGHEPPDRSIGRVSAGRDDRPILRKPIDMRVDVYVLAAARFARGSVEA
jgi:hypothetical protein